MLVVTVELVPGGFGPMRRTIASMRISNLSNLAPISDYRVAATETDNPLTGTLPRKADCIVRGHDRAQSPWALLAKASQETLKADWVANGARSRDHEGRQCRGHAPVAGESVRE
jgi:hypothetical protein